MAGQPQSFQNLLNGLRAHIHVFSVALEQLANQHWAEVGVGAGSKSFPSAVSSDGLALPYALNPQSLRVGANEDAQLGTVQAPVVVGGTRSMGLHEVDVPNECDELIAKPVHERVGAHNRVVVPGHAGLPIGMTLASVSAPIPENQEEAFQEFTDNQEPTDDSVLFPSDLKRDNTLDGNDPDSKAEDSAAPAQQASSMLNADSVMEDWSLELTPIWNERKKRTRRTNARGASMEGGQTSKSKLMYARSRSVVGSMRSSASLDRMRGMLHTGNSFQLSTFIQRSFVASPTSTRRLVWDIAGMALIGYDLITIPFQVFEPAKSWVTDSLAMMTTTFWTLDIPCSFLVGYHKDGFIEMSLSEIAKRYSRSWMLFDIGVIAVDWMGWILTWMSEEEDESGIQGDVGLVRLGKSARFLRVMRLLRLLKVHGRLAEIFERMQSEIVRIALGIIKNVVLIILANHVFACGFWGIGNGIFDIEDCNVKDGFPLEEVLKSKWDCRTWVVAFQMKERSIAYQYTTSLHWSLTQFTPASMEIVPKNWLERTYTVCVLLLAMITFSSFISSLTNAMTQLRNLNSDKLIQQSVLRKYIMQNSVSTALSTRVWSWLQSNPGKVKERIHESDVAILNTLPSSLQAEMQDNVFRPTLIQHPFFFQFAAEHSNLMKRIFKCIKEVSISLEKEVFHTDMVADKMFFVISGVCLYKPYLGHGTDRTSIRSSHAGNMIEMIHGMWFCEPALWCRWKHRGLMVTKTHVEMFGLVANQFSHLMQIELRDSWQAARYARLFVKLVKERSIMLNDVWADFDTLQELAQRSFDDDDEEVAEEKLTRGFTFESKTSQDQLGIKGTDPGADISAGLGSDQPEQVVGSAHAEQTMGRQVTIEDVQQIVQEETLAHMGRPAT